MLRFNPKSGAFLGTFASSDSTNDLQRPEGLVFGPDGNLYITSFRASSSDTDKIDVFAGPQGPQPGAYLGKIDLDQVGGDRAFAQALLFGPNGKLFVPITGGDPHTTGTVRRYDVTTKAFDIFITSAHLGQPWYLTFSQTDPATLAYVTPNDAAPAAASASAGAGPVSTVGTALPATGSPLMPATPAPATLTPTPAAEDWAALVAPILLPASPQGQPVDPPALGSPDSSGQFVPPALPPFLMSMLPAAPHDRDALASSLARDRPAAPTDLADLLFAEEGSGWPIDLLAADRRLP